MAQSSHKRVYLDTSYLYEIVKKRFTQKSDDVSRVVEQSIYNARGKYQIVIPQIAVGEVFAKLPKLIENQREPINALSKLWMSIEELLGEDFNGLLPITYEGLAILKDIKDYDYRIEPTDIVIIAQAASDPQSEYLLTLDRYILSSKWLRNFVDELSEKRKREISLKFQQSLPV